ncbi:MAG: SMP-30/gluconolactonase/LRE family protein [Spirochaetes bacterium]|nr:SMP-30/gluconolactonase/LRE family protein [Spirochaetota bacterium]
MKQVTRKLLWTILCILILLIVLCAGAYVYLKIKSPHLLRFSEGIKERTVRIRIGDTPSAVFIKGMNGCENLYPDDASMRVYVTDLQGYVHLLDSSSWNALKIVKSKKLGSFALGIAKGPDRRLYVNVCESGSGTWEEEGGAVWRISPQLNFAEKLTGNYKGINGLAFDDDGNLYFASGRPDILDPNGHIYRIKITKNSYFTQPEIFLAHVGWANGLYFSTKENKLYFSNTVDGCFKFTPGIPEAEVVYYKTKIAESIDDLCTDTRGRLWMTDPGRSTVKMFNADTKELIRYDIEGIGQTSSCRIRMEHGREILYITELKQNRDPMSQIYDGRGLIVISLKSLEQ